MSSSLKTLRQQPVSSQGPRPRPVLFRRGAGSPHPGQTWRSFSFRCDVEFRDCLSSCLELTELISISLLREEVCPPEEKL